jgi:hypothetical protein
MIKFKIIVTAFCFSISISSCTLINNMSRPGYTERQCKQIAVNYDQLKIGMTKIAVINLIGETSDNIIFPYSGVFPEQKNQWEIWLLCKENPDLWQMIAFDMKTNKLIKVFSDDPDRVGF